MDEHVGMKRVVLDIRAGISPIVQGVVPNTASVREIRQRIEDGIRRVVEENLPDAEWTLEGLRVRLHPSTGYVLPYAQEKARRDAKMAELSTWFKEAAASRVQARASDPHNGKLGWWKVDGIRNSATVKASSADEALKKSEIGSWESASVEWIGEELPEVVT